MNGDALSDLLLAAVTLFLAWRLSSRRPGIAIAMAVIGVAAACGVLRYLGVEEALGPHRFFSLVAACAGLPLLAASVCWPEAPLATRAAAGARFVVLVGGIGVVIVVVFNVALWSDAAAAISALLLMAFALRRRKLIAIAASLALIAGFAISISGAVLGPFNALQGFHILLILSFSLMGWEAQVKVQ
jgi:hypothetical protein